MVRHRSDRTFRAAGSTRPTWTFVALRAVGTGRADVTGQADEAALPALTTLADVALFATLSLSTWFAALAWRTVAPGLAFDPAFTLQTDLAWRAHRALVARQAVAAVARRALDKPLGLLELALLFVQPSLKLVKRRHDRA